MRNKKAAMEMSVGTLVTIVLLMAVLGLGIFLIQKIFKGSTNAIDDINQEVQSQINKLFTDQTTKTVVYPQSREIQLQKGDSGGVGFSIKNNERSEGVFSYETTWSEDDCNFGKADAEDLIILGKMGNNINLGSGDFMEPAILIKLRTEDSDPLCQIRYQISVKKDGQAYATNFFDIEIKS